MYWRTRLSSLDCASPAAFRVPAKTACTVYSRQSRASCTNLEILETEQPQSSAACPIRTTSCGSREFGKFLVYLQFQRIEMILVYIHAGLLHIACSDQIVTRRSTTSKHRFSGKVSKKYNIQLKNRKYSKKMLTTGLRHGIIMATSNSI
jgi:hypothetical protein